MLVNNQTIDTDKVYHSNKCFYFWVHAVSLLLNATKIYKIFIFKCFDECFKLDDYLLCASQRIKHCLLLQMC